MPQQITAVVVSFNTAPLLRRALESIERSTCEVGPIETIVVDNASEDGSPGMVRAGFPWVRLVHLTRNVGFAAGTNVGLRMARGRQLLLLNPDAELEVGALGSLSALLDSMPWVAAVGPRLIYPDGAAQDSAFRFPGLGQILLDYFPINGRLLRSGLNGRYPAAPDPHPVDHPLGACMLIRREALDDVGLLDEEFFMYCEEVDWCMRAHERGWQIYHDPRATVIHHGGQSTRQRSGAMFVALHRSRERLYRKHYGPAFRVAARAISWVGLRAEMARSRRMVRRGLLSPDSGWERISACRELLHST